MESICGNDTDALSVKIARINLALKHRVTDCDVLYRNITVSDFLVDTSNIVDTSNTSKGLVLEFNGRKYDYIIGNPPWGYNFDCSEAAVLDRIYLSANGTKTESYDVFTEKALRCLKPGGVLSFVVPEAILNVKSHQGIRQIILEASEIQYVNYLGNVFDGVQCPCIILQLQRIDDAESNSAESNYITNNAVGSNDIGSNGAGKNNISYIRIPGDNIQGYNEGYTCTYACKGTEVVAAKERFTICTEREISAECFSFAMNDTEYEIVRKLRSTPCARYLKDHAVFALGIVTGNNKECISSVKTDTNEMVLKGSDLLKYRFKPSGNYMEFTPEKYQQVAPAECYRAKEKLLYRFICSQLVFAYDDQSTLSLNSCNILIPQIDGMSCKYVMAVLNSRPAQFLFKKLFSSVKVLRSHIEQIPIPQTDEATQKCIEGYVDRIRMHSGSDKIYNDSGNYSGNGCSNDCSNDCDNDSGNYSGNGCGNDGSNDSGHSGILRLYNELDSIIAGLYGLDEEEYEVIRRSTEGENNFLF